MQKGSDCFSLLSSFLTYFQCYWCGKSRNFRQRYDYKAKGNMQRATQPFVCPWWSNLTSKVGHKSIHFVDLTLCTGWTFNPTTKPLDNVINTNFETALWDSVFILATGFCWKGTKTVQNTNSSNTLFLHHVHLYIDSLMAGFSNYIEPLSPTAHSQFRQSLFYLLYFFLSFSFIHLLSSLLYLSCC